MSWGGKRMMGRLALMNALPPQPPGVLDGSGDGASVSEAGGGVSGADGGSIKSADDQSAKAKAPAAATSSMKTPSLSSIHQSEQAVLNPEWREKNKRELKTGTPINHATICKAWLEKQKLSDLGNKAVHVAPPSSKIVDYSSSATKSYSTASARTPLRSVNENTTVLKSIENVKKTLGYAVGTTRTQVALPQQSDNGAGVSSKTTSFNRESEVIRDLSSFSSLSGNLLGIDSSENNLNVAVHTLPSAVKPQTVDPTPQVIQRSSSNPTGKQRLAACKVDTAKITNNDKSGSVFATSKSVSKAGNSHAPLVKEMVSSSSSQTGLKRNLKRPKYKQKHQKQSKNKGKLSTYTKGNDSKTPRLPVASSTQSQSVYQNFIRKRTRSKNDESSNDDDTDNSLNETNSSSPRQKKKPKVATPSKGSQGLRRSSRQNRVLTNHNKFVKELSADSDASSHASRFDFNSDFSDSDKDLYKPSEEDEDEDYEDVEPDKQIQRNKNKTGANQNPAEMDSEEDVENISIEDDAEIVSGDDENVTSSTKKPEESSVKARLERSRKRNTGQEYELLSGKKIPTRKPLIPNCSHKASCYKCDILTKDDVENLHTEYWGFGNYNKRVQYISNRMVVTDAQRHRTSKIRRFQSVEYYVDIASGVRIRICRAAFLRTFCESDRFVRGVVAKKANSISGCPSNDMRGRTKGSRKNLSIDKLTAVENHIKSFPAYVSHYCRKTTSQRYLASYLTVKKMHDRYLEEKNPPVSYTSYRRIFKKMGLKFKPPKSDTCAKCDAFEISIKLAANNEEEKERLSKQHELHLRKAEKAYELKRRKIKEAAEDSSKAVIVFDLEQCLPVPDLPTGKVYYARQLYAYNLTVVHGKKTHCYMWAEHEARRGANEVASCLYRHITHELPNSVKHLTMFSDCCSGQNRNSIVCAMLLVALQTSNLRTVDHIFLIPGHTRMECDSKHSIIERYKKQSEARAMVPRGWYDIVKEAGNGQFDVFHMRDNFFDFQKLLEKKEGGPLIKRDKDENKKEFRYLETCWFQYRTNSKGIVHVKSSYNEDAPFRNVNFLRRGHRVSDVVETLTKVQATYNPISKKKKEDLLSLFDLIHPRYHSFYRSLKTDSSLDDEDPDLPFEANANDIDFEIE